MKLEANSYISRMVEEEKAMMKKLSTSPHDFFTDITRRLYDNNESIKKLRQKMISPILIKIGSTYLSLFSVIKIFCNW